MKHVTHTLENLGLSDHEIQVYLTCLEYGGLTALGISRLTKLPRTTVYMLLGKMEEKGFLYVKNLGTTTLYQAISGDEVIALLDTKIKKILAQKEEVKDNLYVLNNASKARTQLPHIQFYDGDDVDTILTNAIQKSKNVKIIYHIQKTMFIDSDSFFEKILTLSKKNHVNIQAFLVDSPRAQTISKRDKELSIAYKVLPSGFFFFSQQIITDTGYYHITYGDKVYLMEVIDPLYVNAQRIQFDILWSTI